MKVPERSGSLCSSNEELRDLVGKIVMDSSAETSAKAKAYASAHVLDRLRQSLAEPLGRAKL